MNALRLTSKEFQACSRWLLIFTTRSIEATWSGLILTLFFTLSSLSTAQSQHLTCHGNVEVGFGSYCTIDLVPEQFTSNPSGNYTIELIGTTISGPMSLNIGIDDVIINYAYTYKLTNAQGLFCDSGKITFRDYLGPQCGIFDPIVTAYCTEVDPTLAFTGPGFTDCSKFTYNHWDAVEESCDFLPFNNKKVVKKITRTWTAIDIHGNENPGTCSQVLYILSPDIMDIMIEPTIEIECNKNIPYQVAIDPNNLTDDQLPYFLNNGQKQSIRSACKFAISKIDSDPIIYNGNKKKIFRNWQILDWCSPGTSRTEQQTIIFVDNEAPTINVVDEVTIEANQFTANPFDLCKAIDFLPSATATDQCSEDDEIVITIHIPSLNQTIPNGGVIPSPGLTSGEHTVTYTATDLCGMSSSQDVLVKIVDTTKPVAICTPTKNIGLTSGDSTAVYADEFENGSTDNCCIDRFEVRRQDDPNGSAAFDKHVVFRCGDDDVIVIFRVYDCAGNFNDCTLTVTVQDLIDPIIEAPAPDEELCTEVRHVDLTDKSILQERYGEPIVRDNCDGATYVELTPVITQQDCEGQTIVRSFYAIDAYGNKSDDTVSQTVIIKGVSSFSVIFPDHYTIDCSEALLNQNPVIENQGCGELFTRYTELIYNQDEGACYKVIRTWEVIDWCAFDIIQTNSNGEVVDNATNAGEPHVVEDGYIKFIQEIRVVDEQAPTIISVPDDFNVNVTEGCLGTVTIPSVLTEDNNCSGNVSVVAKIDDNEVQIGTNIQGEIGTTVTIKYLAVDGCNNYSEPAFLNITFVDEKKPTPVCLSLSTEIGAGGVVTIWAIDFESGSSYDNCGLTETRLINKVIDADGDNDFIEDVIQTPPFGNTSIVFTCADVGNNVIQYWIQDEAGNWEFCVTGIYITDADDNDCANVTSSVAGIIQSENGDRIEQVEVEISNPAMPAFMTGFDGFFSFSGLTSNDSYTITPKKDINDDNGISTFDMVLMQRHILGINELNSPYKLIAADVNESGSISTGDMVELRKLILGINSDLPKTNSWRFINADFQFSDPSNPFQDVIQESKDITASGQVEADFIGIKMGDLNLNADVNQLLDNSTDRGDMKLYWNEIAFENNQNISLPLYISSTEDLYGLQLTMTFDANNLEFVGLESENLPGWNSSMYHVINDGNGTIKISWNDAEAHELSSGTEMVKLIFNTLNSSSLSESIHLETVQSINEGVIDNSGDIESRNIVLEIIEDVQEVELLQNAPNPFTNHSVIAFKLNERLDIQLSIVDIAGRLIKQIEGSYEKGHHEIVITESDLPESGVYYYQLTTEKQIATKKLIHIKR